MIRRCLGCMEMFDDAYRVCPHCGYVVGTPAEEAIHIEPGTLLYDRYVIGKVLGYGGFGVTYIAWDGKLQQKVAIKEYLPGEFSTRMPGQSAVRVFGGDKSEQFRDGLKKFIEEAKNLAKFQNEPGIVKVFDSFEDNDTAYIVMEYLDGETLTDYLKREKTIPEDKAVEMLMPVMGSLRTVHDAGLLHRDIAPDNIFLTKSGEVKLIDFGASRYATTSHSRSLTVIIKPGYSPEEQYRSRGDQGPHTDVYALASTLYKMITGKTPPDSMERRAKYESQNKDILDPPHKYAKSISANREIAILNAMNVRIEDRTPDIAAFMRELNADPPAKRIYGKIKKIDLYTWPLWLKVFVPTLLAAIVAFILLIVTGVIHFSNFSEDIIIPENIVSAPDVEGLYKDEAVREIEDGKLLASTAGSIESEYIPAGKIVLQSPIGGTYLEKNGTVYLTISSGKAVESPVNGVTTVPYVIWDEKDAAIEKLLTAGLAQPEIVETYDNSVAYGAVIAQSIEAGQTVAEGTKITLTVSLGPAAFEMPNVEGMSREEAEEILGGKGLTVTVEYVKTDTVPEGNVVSQSIAKGTDVKRGDVISIVVSGGRQTVDVANVIGKTSEEAEKTLKGQGFKVTILENYDDSVASGYVIDQSPDALSAQLPGSTIVIYVSKGKQPITVSFDTCGGEVDYSSKTVYQSDSYGMLPTPTRAGFSFAGWYTSSSGGSRVSESTTVSTAASHTLFARWELQQYSAQWSGGSGYSVSVSRTSSPYGGARTGSISSGSTVYYGDTLKITYTADSGLTIASTGADSITVSGNVTSSDIWAKVSAKQFSASWNTDNGCSITVRRTSSPYAGASTGSISNGGTVYYGDTLKVTYAANNGFSITSTGSDSITVSGNVTSSDIWAKVSAKQFSISWNTGNGYSVAVRRTSSPYAGASTGSISNGDTVYYGDTLKVTYTADSGLTIASTGSDSITVTGNVTSSDIWAKISAKQFSISWNTGTGYGITVKRTASPYAGASAGTISNGGTVYYGDSLSISYAAETGYTLTSTGASSLTVSGNVGSGDIYAKASVKEFSVSWNTNSGYTVTVKRTSSPYAGASAGSISNGDRVYYGDTLSISYSANAGYTLTSIGAQSVTVSADVTSSTIYASVKADSYTYNIKYVSSNGTSLGSSSATYNYGTTNTITPKSFSGYSTPSSQTVKWDSANAKTITFTYTPTAVGSSSTGSNVYSESGSKLSYTATVECISRTSTSAQISITLTATLTGTGAYNSYSQWFRASADSASSGNVQVASYGTWSSKSSSARSESGSTVLTVPLSSTDATSVTVSIYYFQANYNGTEKGSSASSSCSVAIPAY